MDDDGIQEDVEQEEEGEEEGGVEEVVNERKLPELRSLNSDIVSHVCFKSTTTRRVDLFWINFEGGRVKYKTFEPGEQYFINTFVTHPWIFRDADTCAIIHGNNEEIFMPEENPEGVPLMHVNVHIPGMRKILHNLWF